MTSPLTLNAAPDAGFDQPFELLEACHRRVERMLSLLERLAVHLQAHGADEQARQAAADVMRYFDLAGPAHHEDEERHLFPPLLARNAAADPAVEAAVRQLQADHHEMTRRWAGVRADLAAIAAGAPAQRGALDAAAGARWAAFAALYGRHIAVEEQQVYPAAQPLFDAATLAAMGQEMARRRGAA